MKEAIEEIESWIIRYDSSIKRAWKDIEYARERVESSQATLTKCMDEYFRVVSTRDDLKKAVEVLRASK